jgi:hypothetical protein
VLTGTPTTVETAVFTLRVTDSEARTAEKVHTLNVVAEGTAEGPHDFFDYWDSGAGSVHKHHSNSLRTTPLIEQAYIAASSAANWAYDATMDAAEWTPNYNPPTNTTWNSKQLLFRLQTPSLLTDRMVLVWDWYWPIEFKTNCGGVTSFKTFQGLADGHGWWTLMNHQGVARNLAAHVGFTVGDEFRAAHGVTEGGAYPTGMTSNEGVQPAGPGTDAILASGETQHQQYNDRCYPIDHSVWHRVVVEIRFAQLPSAFTDWSTAYLDGATLNSNPRDPDGLGRWHMVSKWYMSEVMDPVRILYRVPMGWGNSSTAIRYVTGWKFEMNSSKSGAIGPINGWGRNFLCLKDMYADENDSNLFRRPVR